MKYGLIIPNYGKYAPEVHAFNYGDAIQMQASELVYKSMGISDSDILRIPECDINDYDGEYVLLPLYSVPVGVKLALLPLPPRIIPMFISVHIVLNELSPEVVDYLRAFSPIGCRDEFTLNNMRRYGIPAYLSGCVTTVFPKRECAPADGKILLVDTPASLEPYIPEHIKEKAERLTHFPSFPPKVMTAEESAAFCRDVRERMDYYKNSASLVVSSRLHAIVPCMAMGIPVIGAFENISYRFSWVDKFIRLYSEEDFSEIDWNPAPVEYEEEKKRLLDFFCRQIRATYDKYASIYEVSEFYENRKKSNYGSLYRGRIKSMHGYMPDKFRYCVWGCAHIGNFAYDIMKEEFPEAELAVAIDSYETGVWHGVPIIKPDKLKHYPDLFIIIANYSGREEGFRLMKELGKAENRDYIYIGTPNG